MLFAYVPQKGELKPVCVHMPSSDTQACFSRWSGRVDKQYFVERDMAHTHSFKVQWRLACVAAEFVSCSYRPYTHAAPF